MHIDTISDKVAAVVRADGEVIIVAEECAVHDHYKQRVIAAKDIDTVVTGKRLGHAVRSLKTPFTRRYMDKEYDPATSPDELEQTLIRIGHEVEEVIPVGPVSGPLTALWPSAISAKAPVARSVR